MQANRTDFSLVSTRTGRRLQWLGVLLIAGIISACSGGDGGAGGGAAGGPGAGGPGAAATLSTLEVTPATATVVVGGTAQYSVVARDSAGLVMATPPVTWASGTPAVGTITPAGLATGVGLGQTPITATAGSVVSPPAVLNVVKTTALSTLEVTPATATVAVGGTAQYSVVARDGAGVVVATPPVTWASGTPAVGTITPDGLATGVGLGQTPITATAGSVVSPSAVLNVVETIACDGIAAVPQWTVNLEYDYSDDFTTGGGANVTASHSASVTATLTATGPVFGKPNWAGPLAFGVDHLGAVPKYAVSIFESFDNQVSDPTIVADVNGQGQLVPTPGVDGFRLEVDLSTCTFRFFAAPSLSTVLNKTEHAVHTLPGPDEGLQVFTQVTELGLLQKGVTPLGSWRTLGMGDFSKFMPAFAAYSVAATVPIDVDAYIPSGVFAQAAFFDPVNLAPRQDKAYMYYKILPQF